MSKLDLDAITLYTRRQGQFASHLLITAHGGFVDPLKNFPVPALMSLRFYSPQGVVTTDSDINKFTGREATAVKEVIAVGELCTDYLLSHFESHTEGILQANVEAQDEVIGLHNKDREELLGDHPEIEKTSSHAVAFDIVAISPRPRKQYTKRSGQPGMVRLSDVLEIANRQRPFGNYQVVHCLFCRVKME